MIKIRYLVDQVKKDLKKKMVFIAGPRQVGKTTLAKSLISSGKNYLNWDIAEQRERILKNQIPVSGLIIFDEIHKYRTWRNYLKGVFDGRTDKQQILVIGSAKLDVYRRGGDSLQGRYHFLRIHPLSVKELAGTKNVVDRLLKLGGFPEPYFSNSEIEASRWRREYRSRLVREEVTSLETVEDLGNLELMMIRLPELVGSPLSINALREDLQVSHRTVTRWLTISDNLYATFRLSPFGSKKLRSVKKEQKLYMYDWAVIANESARFENFIGSHLLKWVHFLQDTQGRELDLQYFRDVTGKEIDFIVTENKKPILAVEVKLADMNPASQLKYFGEKFPDCELIQVVYATKNKDSFREPRSKIQIIGAEEFLMRFV